MTKKKNTEEVIEEEIEEAVEEEVVEEIAEAPSPTIKLNTSSNAYE